MHSLKRDNSIDQVYSNTASKKMAASNLISPQDRQMLTNRKASVDPISNKRDDIFGNSVTREMYMATP